MCVKSGYKTITPVQIANCFGALEAGLISLRSVRVYFACLAMVAVREAARRYNTKMGRRCEEKGPRYQLSEAARLTGLPLASVKRGLRKLSLASVLEFHEGAIKIAADPIEGVGELLSALAGKRSARRPIPVPRAVLRFLAGSKKGAVLKTVVAYLVRGLSLDRKTGEVRSAGTVKASWISGVFGLSVRSVKSARKALIESGFIGKDRASFQRKLNRDGAYFQVKLSWDGKARNAAEESGQRPHGFGDRAAEFSPPVVENRVFFSPPYKDSKTSYESKNQKTQSGALKLSRVSTGKAGEGRPPVLRDVKLQDLEHFSRVRMLFQQAVQAGWVGDAEADFLNWVGAVVRAKTVEARDPVRLFVGIVKKKRWELITQAQEDRARQAIRIYCHGGSL